jgi:hypothetical protein
MNKSLIFFAIFCIFSCSSSTDPEEDMIDMKYFSGSWLNSYEEEDTNTNFIYRPENYKSFPSSWFRMKYVFNEDNSCQWLVLAGNDAHYLKSGTWTQSRYNNNSIIIHDSAGVLQENKSFVIVRLEENLLEFKRISD